MARKAAALGVRHATHEDLVEAVLTDGLSTRDVATYVSGRGLGMSALRAGAAMVGGRIEIESTTGSGTHVRCVFDMEQAA